MRSFLRSDVANLGKRGDICDVADGYARNFLFPKGQAIPANSGIANQAANMRRAQRDQGRPRPPGRRDRRPQPGPARHPHPDAGRPEGKLFGSVTTANIADAIAEQAGLEIDRYRLHLPDPSRRSGPMKCR